MGRAIELRSLNEAELEAKCRQTDREGECYRTVRRLAAEHAAEIERRYPRILRRVGGYNLDRFTAGQPFNLAHLLVGSEGTLAVTLEAKLHLEPLPRAKALLVIQFADLLEALAVTPSILAHQPAAVEVIDKYVLEATRLNAEANRLRDFLAGDPGAILIVEFYGERAEDLPARLNDLEADLKSRSFGYHHHRALEPAAQARIWKLRRLSLGLSMAEKGDAKAISFVEDTAVAAEHLHDYIAEFLAILRRHGTKAGVYAHASVGCLHVRPVIDLKTESGVRAFESIAAEVADLVLKYGGALSGEHGDGLVRSPFQEKMYGPMLYQAFRELKRTFDPANVLNPGKIVDAPPLTANLRYGPRYVTPDVPTIFDFSADGGMTRAAELCVGVGECRKIRGGTMCPSYQATRDEQHSTRGRANAPASRPDRTGGPDELDRSRRACGPRSLSGVQGVQKRMSHERGHGPAQGGVFASVLSSTWRAVAEPLVRPRRRGQPLGMPLGAAVELAGAQRPGALAERSPSRHRSASLAAGLRPPDISPTIPRSPRIDVPASARCFVVSGHVHELSRAGNRPGRRATARTRRLRRHARCAVRRYHAAVGR